MYEAHEEIKEASLSETAIQGMRQAETLVCFQPGPSLNPNSLNMSLPMCNTGPNRGCHPDEFPSGLGFRVWTPSSRRLTNAMQINPSCREAWALDHARPRMRPSFGASERRGSLRSNFRPHTSAARVDTPESAISLN